MSRDSKNRFIIKRSESPNTMSQEDDVTEQDQDSASDSDSAEYSEVDWRFMEEQTIPDTNSRPGSEIDWKDSRSEGQNINDLEKDSDIGSDIVEEEKDLYPDVNWGDYHIEHYNEDQIALLQSTYGNDIEVEREDKNTRNFDDKAQKDEAQKEGSTDLELPEKSPEKQTSINFDKSESRDEEKESNLEPNKEKDLEKEVNFSTHASAQRESQSANISLEISKPEKNSPQKLKNPDGKVDPASYGYVKMKGLSSREAASYGMHILNRSGMNKDDIKSLINQKDDNFKIELTDKQKEALMYVRDYASELSNAKKNVLQKQQNLRKIHSTEEVEPGKENANPKIQINKDVKNIKSEENSENGFLLPSTKTVEKGENFDSTNHTSKEIIKEKEQGRS